MTANETIDFAHFTLPGHMDTSEEETAYFYVVARHHQHGDLIVAKFPYDADSMDGPYLKQQAERMANAFTKAMAEATKQ